MEEILNRYTKYRTEIQEYLKFLVNSLIEKYGEVSDSFIVSLDLLAMNLEVLFKSKDEMNEKGMTETDKYRGEKKSGAMQAFFNAQNYIQKILNGFGFTPAAKSKIRENTDKQDVQKLLENLVN